MVAHRHEKTKNIKGLLNFTITQLNYVWVVHQTGHFGHAARQCHVTQPTLSMQIQKLEQELGVVIFDRSKKPVLLTEAGKKLIEQIQKLLHEARKIENIIEQQHTEELKGELTFAVIPTIAPYVLPRLLPVLEKQNPLIRLNIREMQTQKIIESLDNDVIDVGLLATPLNLAKIYEFPLYYEPFSILCQKGHPLAHFKKAKYNLLKDQDIWLLEEGHCLRNQVLDICSIKSGGRSQFKYQFQSGSLETLKNLVDSYGGYTLLPSLATHNVGSKTCLIPFERPIPSRQIGLVYQREHYKQGLIEALGQAILDAIPEDLRKLRPKDLAVIDI